MNNTIQYLMNNITEVTFGMTLLENIGCTYIQTEEIIRTGQAEGVSGPNIQKILNFRDALEFMKNNYQYPVELGILMEYNAMNGWNDDTHPNPGYVRTDSEVRISKCSYIAPPVSESEALDIVNAYHDFDMVEDQFSYLATALPKAQIFYNGNKRTALLACNHLLCYNDVGMVFSLDNMNKYKQYINILLQYYEDSIDLRDAMEQVKWFLS